MTDTLPLTQHSHQQQHEASLQFCGVCGRWERQFALQASELAEVKQQLLDRDQQLVRLQQDMEQLNTKYVSAIDRVADIQHEKDLVELDLEELSCKLFEEANGMVAVEKREKWLLETQLQAVQQQLTDEQAQLKELRQRFLQWDNDEQQRYRHHGRHKKKSATASGKRSLINTTLKEEDETEDTASTAQNDNDDDDDNDDQDEDDNYDDQDSDDEDGDDDDDDDETWEDALDNQENMDDPQLRARHDLALLHGMPQQKNRHQQQRKTTPASIQRSNTSSTLDQKKKQQPRSVSMPPPPSASKGYTIVPTIDQVQLEAFQQFVHSASTLPLKKLYQFAYMKYCQLEDVEPCLRFGPNSRLSVKKMMDYLLQQPCFIQQMSMEKTTGSTATTHPQHNTTTTTVIPSSVAQRSLLWDRWHGSSNSSNKSSSSPHSSRSSSSTTTTTTVTAIGCAACGRPRQKDLNGMDTTTYYQFKMDEKDDWLPMDQYCRDRLVAVCEFFVFIRNIHLRLYTHRTIDDLYSENIRLRLSMFYSRMGALPVVLGGMGLNADAIGKACPPLDQDDVSDGSTSSQIPKTPK